MMRSAMVGLVLALGVATAGCGSADTGTAAGEYLVTGLADRTDLYLAPSVDTRPLTLDQLGEENAALAIAVDVEIYDQLAIAFARDANGEAIYTRDAIVGLWRVLDRDLVAVTPQEGELSPPGGGDPVYVPTSVGGFDRDGFQPVAGSIVEGSPTYDLVDFSDLIDTSLFDDVDAWNEINMAHPGCA